MPGIQEALQALPPPLSVYQDAPGASIAQVLLDRMRHEPFNGIATGIFLLAIIHTFAAAYFTRLAHRIQHRADERERAAGRLPRPSVAAGAMHFFGEVEVVFGLWAVVLLLVMTAYAGFGTAEAYFNKGVTFTEALFVVVIMALAGSRPIVGFAEAGLRRISGLGGGTPAAWWVSILTIGPLLGSFITEPAAMTICALLLARQFFVLKPSTRLKYATLGLLFVNVSIGGTLTHFAAPPVLMVAQRWNYDLAFMLSHFGWRAIIGIAVSTLAYYLVFRRELHALERPEPEVGRTSSIPTSAGLLPVPRWVTVVHIAFMAWTVFTAHYPVLFVGGFMFYLGFVKATEAYQGQVEVRSPLLVGFFLAGLVIHGGLQAWWIQPILARLTETPLFLGATLLTSFNDNALITYLATLVPDLSEPLKHAVLEGAVTGGGLTVIANAPNPAGQSLLSRYFDGAVAPLGLLGGAALPTIIAALAFRLL